AARRLPARPARRGGRGCGPSAGTVLGREARWRVLGGLVGSGSVGSGGRLLHGNTQGVAGGVGVLAASAVWVGRGDRAVPPGLREPHAGLSDPGGEPGGGP